MFYFSDEKNAVDVSEYERLSNFIPRQVLQFDYKNNEEKLCRIFEPELIKFYNSNRFIMGKEVEVEDFVQSMLTGYIPAKDMFQSQGGIINALDNYDPSKGERDVICPECGASFWSHTAGNSLTKYKELNLIEWREDKKNCPKPVFINNNKVCGRIVGGPYQEEGKNRIKAGNQYYEYCGHPIELMSFARFIREYVMKPLITENNRYRHAKTKGRTNVDEIHRCPKCNSECSTTINMNIASKEERFCMCRCGHSFHISNETIHIKEKGSVSYDQEDEESEISIIKNTLCAKNEIPEIEDQEYKQEISLHVNGIRQGYQKIKSSKKFAKKKKSVEIHESYYFGENCSKLSEIDPNSDEIIESDKCFSNHREISDKILNKILHYTECLQCGHCEDEKPEKQKFEKDQINIRREWIEKIKSGFRDNRIDSSTDLLEKMTDKELLNTMLSDLGSILQCKKCGSLKLQYHGVGCKCGKHEGKDVKIHIFQPSQRHVKNIDADLVSFFYCCPQCGDREKIKKAFKILERNNTEICCNKCGETLSSSDVEIEIIEEAKDLIYHVQSLAKIRKKYENLKEN